MVSSSLKFSLDGAVRLAKLAAAHHGWVVLLAENDDRLFHAIEMSYPDISGEEL
jgi:hypothetical protein